MDALPLVALGVTAFAATNLDDMLLLVLFFSNRSARPRDVFLGQAMGIGLLVTISLILSMMASVIPRPWVGLLGLLPVLIGARELIARRQDADDGGDAPRPNVTILQHDTGQRRAVAVAAVTLANGGDNIGVYTPLFAAHSAAETLVLLLVFIFLTWVWLQGAYYLVHRSAMAGRLQRLGHAVYPYALIILGAIIMVKSFVI